MKIKTAFVALPFLLVGVAHQASAAPDYRDCAELDLTTIADKELPTESTVRLVIGGKVETLRKGTSPLLVVYTDQATYAAPSGCESDDFAPSAVRGKCGTAFFRHRLVCETGTDNASGQGGVQGMDPEVAFRAELAANRMAAIKRLQGAQDAQAVFAARGERGGYAGGTQAGTFEGAVAETVQILGEIVVERATGAAFQRIRKELQAGLGCDPAEAADGSSTGGKTAAKPRWPQTCSVMRALRLQDLATSREALLNAILADVASQLLASAQLPPDLEPFVRQWHAAILPALARLRSGGGEQIALLLVSALESWAEEQVKSEDAKLKPVTLAGAAVVKCRLLAQLGDYGGKLASCPIVDVVTSLSKGESETVREAARRIAVQAVAALTVVVEGKPDARARLKHAVEATFDAACFAALGVQCVDPDVFVAESATPVTGPPPHPMHNLVLFSLREAILAAIDGDTNRMLAVTVRGLTHAVVNVGTAEAPPEQAIRLLGSILLVAETYVTPKEGATPEQLHEQRKKVIESLIDETTDRTTRPDGDLVVSVGGSLRVAAGARIKANSDSDASSVFYGPVSLPLGFGLDAVGDVGFHAELGIIDLGNYLSFESDDAGMSVRKPDPADLLVPSATVSLSFGKSMPFMLGATASYSPSYSFASDTNQAPERGSFNIGFISGVYVPFFDFN